MGKFGVGVGEEFPVDEQQPREEPPAHERMEAGCCGSEEDWARRREMWREARRRFRDQMRAEWHARRHAMREHFRRQEAVEPMDRDRHLHHLVIAGLALIGLAALIGSHRRRT